MGKEKLEKFTTKQLERRKKLRFTLLIILISVGVLNIAIAIYSLIIGKGINITLVTSAIGCFVIALVIYIELKRTKEEITNRENH